MQSVPGEGVGVSVSVEEVSVRVCVVPERLV